MWLLPKFLTQSFCKLILLVCLAGWIVLAQEEHISILSGQVTDVRGAVIIEAQLKLTNNNGLEQSTVTNTQGYFTFNNLALGKYTIEVISPGYTSYTKQAIEINKRKLTLNITLSPTLTREEVNIPSQNSSNPGLQNGLTTRVIRGKDLDMLPTGPGGLAATLRTLAVPTVGPNGPQILVNGFSNGRLPPKESIREIRINDNPFSAEYNQLGFGRIEILTKPGTDKFQGELYTHFNDESLNSRNPFSSYRAPFQSRLSGGNLSGPILTKRASFFMDAERYRAESNALITATVLTPNLNLIQLNQIHIAPEQRINISPRVDYQLNSNNTLVGRYAYINSSAKNAGIGNFSLASQALNINDREHTIQLTDTAIIGGKIVNETRFQYMHINREQKGLNQSTTIIVPEAFVGGGSMVNHSIKREDRWELQNQTIWNLDQHTFKAGVQLRGIVIENNSPQNFNGAFTFGGGLAPELDVTNQPINGLDAEPILVPITGIERYRRTLLFQRLGFSPAMMRSLGGSPTQFAIADGNARAKVQQYELGAFVQDDWRIRPNFTLGLGIRSELQNNIKNNFDIAPRISFAWAPTKYKWLRDTAIRGGLGIFYERFNEDLTLQANHLNGENLKQFLITDPIILSNYPMVPSATDFNNRAFPQTTIRIADNLRTPYTVQSSISVERQLPLNFMIAATFIHAKTRHALRSVNITAPLLDSSTNVLDYRSMNGEIFEYQSNGNFKQNELALNVTYSYQKKMTFYATYILNKARSDTDNPSTFPASTYNLAAEYGRSALDVRHSFYWGGWFSAPLGLDLYALMFARSGIPFNITTGQDQNGDNLYTERPAFAVDLTRPSVILTKFGAFDINPTPSQRIIPRNYGIGPSYFSTSLRISKSFNLGSETNATAHNGLPSQHNDRSILKNLLLRKYRLSFAVQVDNLFNRTNLGTPVGNLSSPLFGQSISVASPYNTENNSLGNRRIQLQVYFSF
jgi:hypothetical protein